MRWRKIRAALKRLLDLNITLGNRAQRYTHLEDTEFLNSCLPNKNQSKSMEETVLISYVNTLYDLRYVRDGNIQSLKAQR